MTQAATVAFLELYGYALLGMVISLLLHSSNRDQSSTATPYKFSMLFLLLDNWKRILLNLLALFAAVRFYPDLFGNPINPFLSFGIGLGFDKLLQMLKDKAGFMQVNRDKITPAVESKTENKN